MSILLLAMLVIAPAPTTQRYAVSGKVFFDDSGSHYVTVYWYEGNKLLGEADVHNSGGIYFMDNGQPNGNCKLIAECSWNSASLGEYGISYEDYVYEEIPGHGRANVHYHNFNFNFAAYP